ncbi:unnamed protein product [Adineta steineri]|uniref:RDD domain-containing protein n=1 Tax=Adineta steineri TaxID=433720 RepID=A0A814B1V0_9BILA|nr:unnamed protein product [Adineta steineri]CAF0923101.1 unnamed protein product [Adineta steineri]
MTLDEYAELVRRWQQAYYTWNVNCVTYYNTMMLNSSQQFIQQIPMFTSANLLAMLTETNRSQPFDPLAEIRNARLKIASMWRRFLAETIDFILLHVFKILVIFILSSYFDIIDESRLTLTYIISNLLYDETFSFPIELICIEFTYIVASIGFESFCLTRYGATPGKRLLRLRVLKCDHLQIQENGDLTIEPGTMLNAVAAITRSSFKSLMSIFLFPAVVVALMTSQHRQTSYDMAANAVVVELEPQL